MSEKRQSTVPELFSTTLAADILGVNHETLRGWDKRCLLPVADRELNAWRRLNLQELVLVGVQVRFTEMGIPPWLAGRFAESLKSALFYFETLANFAAIGWFHVGERHPDKRIAFGAVTGADLGALRDAATWRDVSLFSPVQGIDQAEELGSVRAAVAEGAMALPFGINILDIGELQHQVRQGIRRVLGDPHASVTIVRHIGETE